MIIKGILQQSSSQLWEGLAPFLASTTCCPVPGTKRMEGWRERSSRKKRGRKKQKKNMKKIMRMKMRIRRRLPL